MNTLLKLGTLSIICSAALLADIKVESSAKVISEKETEITLNIKDTETEEPKLGGVAFKETSISKGSNISGYEVTTTGDYKFTINNECKTKVAELKDTFSSKVNGKLVKVPYTICKAIPYVAETKHPYKNNTKQEFVLDASGLNIKGDYQLTIKGETESNFDFVTVVDKNGKVLVDAQGKKLNLSGKLDEKIILTQAQVTDGKVKVLFTSDSSQTRYGVKMTLGYADVPVNNIKDASVYEGDSLTHDVFFAKPLLKATEYSYSVQEENATKLIRGASYLDCADYNPDEPTFTKGGSYLDCADYNPDEPTFTKGVTYNPQTKMIKVPAGVQTFSIIIESFEDVNPAEKVEKYTITVGDKTAEGSVLNIGN